MLNLSNLRKLLSQVLSPSLHTAVLFTPEGQLVSYAASPYTSKDEVRVLVGLSGELWQESREDGMGQLDSEVFHLFLHSAPLNMVVYCISLAIYWSYPLRTQCPASLRGLVTRTTIL